MNLSNIKTVQFQAIDYQYSEEGYINVSKMCKPFNVVIRKLINRNSVQDYIKQLEIETGDSTLIHKISGGDSKKQGIYTKPQIALYIASLLSEQMYETTKEFIKKYIKEFVTSNITLPANNVLTVTKSYTKEINGYTFQYRQDEYINLTKMCKQAGKELKSFLRQADTKAKLKALEDKVSNMHLPLTERVPLIQKRVGGTPTEQGTYGHPLVALFLAQWLSPEFAVAMIQLVEAYFKADVSLATNILQRTTVTEFTSEQSRTLGEVLVTKSADKDLDWISARKETKNSNKRLNAELTQCPNTSKAVYSLSQSAIVENLTGSTITQIKKEKGLTKSATVREAMDTDELITLAFTEMLAAKRISNDKPFGDKKCAGVCGNTAKAVKSFSDLTTGNIND